MARKTRLVISLSTIPPWMTSNKWGRKMSERIVIISEEQLFYLCKDDNDFGITVAVASIARMITYAPTRLDITDCIPDGKRLAEKEIEGLWERLKTNPPSFRLVSDSVNEIIQRPEVFQKIKKKIKTNEEKWGEK